MQPRQTVPPPPAVKTPRPGFRIPPGTIGVAGTPDSFALAELHYAALPRCRSGGDFASDDGTSEVRLFRVQHPHQVRRDRFAEHGLRVLLPGTEIPT